MTTTNTGTPLPVEDESHDDLEYAIRDYVRTYVLWHGRPQAARRFRRLAPHPLALPGAGALGEIPAQGGGQGRWRRPRRHRSGGLGHDRQPETATTGRRTETPGRDPGGHPAAAVRRSPRHRGGTVQFSAEIPATTLRRRLTKLAGLSLADSIPHHLDALGPNPMRRYFPTERGIEAAARAEHGAERFLREYPVSREWFRILTERLDAVAAHLSHVAAMIAHADPQQQPVRVDPYRQGPYDLLITLSGGRSLGIVRQGPALSSANLRYRLRSLEQLRTRQRPTATLVC